MPRCVWDDWYWSKGVLTEWGPRVFMLFYRHLYSQCLGMGHRNCSFGLVVFDSTPFVFSFGPPLDFTLTAGLTHGRPVPASRSQMPGEVVDWQQCVGLS